MNIRKILAWLLIVPSLALTQTPVDNLVRTLDSLSSFPVRDWKASPDLKTKIAGNPALPGFDDSRWDNLRLDEKIYPDSCWIRKEIVLPERILGRPVAGAVRLKVSVDDSGYLWVNGGRRATSRGTATSS